MVDTKRLTVEFYAGASVLVCLLLGRDDDGILVIVGVKHVGVHVNPPL